MGVTIMAGTEGCIIEAPAATAYAVLPVGVDTIRPSPCTEVMYLPSKNKSMLLKYGEGPRSITTSFKTFRKTSFFSIKLNLNGTKSSAACKEYLPICLLKEF